MKKRNLLSNAAHICAEYWVGYLYENDRFRIVGDTISVDLPFEINPGSAPISFFLGSKEAVIRTLSMFISHAAHEDVSFDFHCDVLPSAKLIFAFIARSFKECKYVQFNCLSFIETGSLVFYGPKFLLNVTNQ